MLWEKKYFPSEITGEYVDAKDWNNLISQKDVLVIDARNIYETSVGKFKNSTDPSTTSFKEFPKWLDKNINQIKNYKKVQCIVLEEFV